MPHQGQEQMRAPEENKNARHEKLFVPDQRSFGMPNSLMGAITMTPPPGTPNSVLREMLDPQIPEAEEEADRLSQGIRSGTPDSVRRQMGRRLGSDFSSVRFHDNSESVRQNDIMGSRAYTRGGDIYFGRGGFDPSVAAHELVHTVQQGAAPGCVGQSVAAGTIQRNPFGNGKVSHRGKVFEAPPSERVPARVTFTEPNRSILDYVKNGYFDRDEESEDETGPQGQGNPAEAEEASADRKEPLSEAAAAEADEWDEDEAEYLVTDDDIFSPDDFVYDPYYSELKKLKEKENKDVSPEEEEVSEEEEEEEEEVSEGEEDDEEEEAYPPGVLPNEGETFAPVRRSRNPQRRIFGRADIPKRQINMLAAYFRQENPRFFTSDEEQADEGLDGDAVRGPVLAGLEAAGNAGGDGIPAAAAAQPVDKRNRLGRMAEANNRFDAGRNFGEAVHSTTRMAESLLPGHDEAASNIADFVNTAEGAYLHEAALGASLATAGTEFRNMEKNRELANKGLSPTVWKANALKGTSSVVKSASQVINVAKDVTTMAQGAHTAANILPVAGPAVAAAAAVPAGLATTMNFSSAIGSLAELSHADQERERIAAADRDSESFDGTNQRMRRAIKHAELVEKRNLKSGTAKMAGVGLSGAAAAASLSGVGAPVGLGLGATAGLVSGFAFAYDKASKYEIHSKVVAKELNIHWSEEIRALRFMIERHNPRLRLNTKEARRIILAAHQPGFHSLPDVYNKIKKERAEFLLQIAQTPNPYQYVAIRVIQSLGIQMIDEDNHRFSSEAKALLMEKLL